MSSKEYSRFSIVEVALSSTMMREGSMPLASSQIGHGLALRHGLAGALAAGDHGDAVRVRLQPLERGVQAVP